MKNSSNEVKEPTTPGQTPTQKPDDKNTPDVKKPFSSGRQSGMRNI